MLVAEFSQIDLVFGAVLVAIIVAISIVDFRELIIPDKLNILLGAMGFAYQLWLVPEFPILPVVFSALVFAIFFLVQQAFLYLRGVGGLGLGDVKMAAASALWISPWNLPIYILVSCCAALIFVVFLAIKYGALIKSIKVPFGPFLGCGLILTWLIERLNVTTLIPN